MGNLQAPAVAWFKPVHSCDYRSLASSGAGSTWMRDC